MFKINDFWTILEYIAEDEHKDELDSNLRSIAKSELGRAKTLFENTIDQSAFASSDYRRLRTFLIHLYATQRTITTVQRDARNVFFLPSEHLDELCRSFGFDYSHRINNFETKVNFFLDLVNLYKSKGTPSSLSKVLSYFGIKQSEIVEYFLKLDSEKNLIFDPFPVDRNVALNEYVSLVPLKFEDLTSLDPNWMQTKSEIYDLIDKNKISLPSKSPYFSIRPSYDFKLIETILSFFRRYMSDACLDFINNGTTQTRDIYISKLNISTSVTELYLACIYVFQKLYGTTETTGSDIIINNLGDGYTELDELNDFLSEYDEITSKPDSRETRQKKIEEYNDKLSIPLEDYPLKEFSDVESLLEQMNPELKDEIDVWSLPRNIYDLFPHLLYDLNQWIEENIQISLLNLPIIFLGSKGLVNIQEIMDFFKPYRARFLLFDMEFIIDNPLMDSVRIHDEIEELDIKQQIIDFGTANSEPCFDNDNSYYSRLTFDCGSHFDLGIVDDKFLLKDINTLPSQHLIECGDDKSKKIETDYKYLDLGNSRFDNKIRELNLIDKITQSSGWNDTFDSDNKFDCKGGNDFCIIDILDSKYHFEEITLSEELKYFIIELLYKYTHDGIRGSSNLNPEKSIEWSAEFEDTTSPTDIIISSGFFDFDEDAKFDEPLGKEVVELSLIQLERILREYTEELTLTDSFKQLQEDFIHESIRGSSEANPEDTIESYSESSTNMITTSGFFDFDSDVNFDEPTGKEIVDIRVVTTPLYTSDDKQVYTSDDYKFYTSW